MHRYLLAVTAAAVGVTAAAHQHKHQHLHQRDMATTTQVVATATVFEVNGTPISKEDACEELRMEDYTWKNPGDAAGVCSTTSAALSPRLRLLLLLPPRRLGPLLATPPVASTRPLPNRASLGCSFQRMEWWFWRRHRLRLP